MNFPFYIASRYLIAKKSKNVINLISAISVLGICIGSMALIIILSVFNGFESLVVSLLNSFSPDLQITIKEGKVFNPAIIPVNSIKAIDGVMYYTEVLEENALLKYKKNQYIARIKGVSNNYIKSSGLDSMLVGGQFILQKDSDNFAVLGAGIQHALSISMEDEFTPINVSVPKRDKNNLNNTINPENVFNRKNIYAAGIFSIQQNIDEQYMLVPIEFARSLLNYSLEVSAIEIMVSPNADIDKIQSQINELTGNEFEIKNRYQQNDLIYKIMNSEKWAVFIILTFILVIATFNIIGSLTMLIIEKRKDISILNSIGASYKTIRKIFILEGMLISSIGLIAGFILGFMVCYLQQKYGIVKLNGGSSFIINAYPVNMKLEDFLLVFATVLSIAFVASWYPAKQTTKNIQLPSS